MKKSFLILVIAMLFNSCEKQKVISAQEIVDKSIEVAGGNKIKNAAIAFNFRDKHYKATRNNGVFQFERIFKDSTIVIRDVLSNDGFKRYNNNLEVKVADSMILKYLSSVNSVHYFSILPFGLNDAAVNKEYIDKVTLKGKDYHKIKVTFNQDGGGEDFEDVFVYWINAKSYKTEYIAYSYEETDGVGIRFRAAFNERYVNGIRFVDYVNYKPNNSSTSLQDLDESFEKNQLKLLSKIELTDMTVN
ncbi:deoxyribose-phosphate aldolase [Sabulilitoribacter arenilitoris]|uniref:Deoxyribose-phosphate aldolase n=1 Tax=Wocania arenilitoris TaxID=2044858 RepID=A0AAE3EP42_9FLAO|nr:DUF6503 family protein [Wocania arenilitoris]MCF7567962.1 deoxyribose-phosphate aldolase [Wocania arenilitoris]